MVFKILAVISLVTLPFSVGLWYKSHKHPTKLRYDVTEYNSLDVYLKEGLCCLQMVTMPTKSRIRSRYQGSLGYDPRTNARSLFFTSKRKGPYRFTWLVFPFWLTTSVLLLFGAIPIAQGPVRRWWRQIHGWCLDCGYDLRGTKSGRCPECGTRFR